MPDEKMSRCALCEQAAPLLFSHVVPSFVFRWLKETSATGFLRYTESPNRRQQDGLKLPWLCADCEALFSGFERQFANNVFHPLNADSAAVARYGPWMLKFCVSVSWRRLKYARDYQPFGNMDAPAQESSERALRQWANFLLAKASHPGEFEQHLLPLDEIESTNIEGLPSNINRYLLRAIDTTVATGKHSAVTYVKMGKFALFGFIRPPKQKWIGTKIHVNSGFIGPRQYELPDTIMEFLTHQAQKAGQLYDGISEAQHDKIERAALSDIERFRQSGTLDAMLSDQRMFGKAALLRKKKP